ncbi:MAG: hypothetical protein KAW19_05090 [Candidatus Aminicenantes bacterium]|nr:hypothetical protein [Candidatus Aminicenantes bacterium]
MSKASKIDFIVFKGEDKDRVIELLKGKGFDCFLKIFKREDYKEITELLEKHGIEYFTPTSRYG